MDKQHCVICGLEFENIRSLSVHIKPIHKISTEEYYLKYINLQKSECLHCKSKTKFLSLTNGYSKYCCIKCSKLDYYKVQSNRDFVSRRTREAMSSTVVKEKMSKFFSTPKSDETLKRMGNSSRKRFEDENFRKKIYTKERNAKISNSKIEYWKNNKDAKKRVSNLWKLRKEKDEKKWREDLLKASSIGFKKIFSPNGNTSLEEKLYRQLELEKINFIPQFVLDYKIFDAYLPDFNLIIEIDGTFWHPTSLSECKYEFQKKSYFNDLEKENLLKQKGIKLMRIRENEFPDSIIKLINK